MSDTNIGDAETYPDVGEQLHAFSWSMDTSVRYHERRQAFYERTDAFVNGLNLIVGSGAFIAMIKGAPDPLVLALAALVAIVSLINITMRSAQMASLHAQLKQRFIALQIKLNRIEESDSDALDRLKHLRELRLRIEADEPTIYRIVHVQAHNELAVARDYTEAIYEIPLWKGLTGNFIRWETVNLRKRVGTGG